MSDINRRRFLLSTGAMLLPALAARGSALMTVYKDPSCGCCSAWIEHIERAGFPAKTVIEPKINAMKTRLGVPPALWSCHTAQLEGYALEGHVPARAVVQLLESRPPIRGLAVAGMPIGSPGMEVTGANPETYDVMAFGSESSRLFMRFRGPDPVST